MNTITDLMAGVPTKEPATLEARAEAREERRREAEEAAAAKVRGRQVRGRQERMAAAREANERAYLGATGEHTKREGAVLATRAKALEARRDAGAKAFPFPQAWNEKVEQAFRACEAEREVAITACHAFQDEADTLLLVAEGPREVALVEARAELSRLRGEAADVADQLERALIGSGAEVVGSLQSRISAYPSVLAAAELRVAKCDLDLQRVRVAQVEATFWLSHEENTLRLERQRYEASRCYQDGLEAKRASEEWAALNTHIRGLEAKAAEATRELETVSQGARQKAERVGRLATAGKR